MIDRRLLENAPKSHAQTATSSSAGTVTSILAGVVMASGFAASTRAADLVEVEPNDSKAQALINGDFVLSAGDALIGTSTGASTVNPGVTSVDMYRVRTRPAHLGVYRHRLTITSSGSGSHVGSLRGLPSSSTGTGVGDVSFQLSISTSTGTTPARTSQWYGFGREERVYYRVTGTTSTTAPYRAALSSELMEPTVFTDRIVPGQVSIRQSAETDASYDRDMFLFDDAFNPIVGIDDNDSVPLTANLGVGIYYIAYGRNNTAAGRMAGVVGPYQTGGIQGFYQTGAVLDFDDVVASSSQTSPTSPVTIMVETPSGTIAATAPAPLGSYNIAWFQLSVCAPCPGNFNNVGGTNAQDILDFFEAYEQGSTCADVDRDGGITGNDVAAFFRAFDNGGC